MTNPQVKEIKINDERGVYRMIVFMKAKVDNEKEQDYCDEQTKDKGQ